MSNLAKIDYWIKNNKNVLFFGKHGVGKTAMIVDGFTRHNLKWKYFSASTMDPWVDFVGVPKEVKHEQPREFQIIKELAKIDKSIAIQWVVENWKLANESASRVVNNAIDFVSHPPHLSLVRPEIFANGEIEALFFDEYNRSHKKVRNAVMELIQFKSLNGVKYPNLRLVWAAVNPKSHGDYDVEEIDPAQEDRFHIKVEIPYKPNVDWFRGKYGNKVADSAIDWWNDLSNEDKDLVSPRRLEYVLDIFAEKGDIRDALPKRVNATKLISSLATGPITDKIDGLIKSRDAQEARLFLQNENNYAAAIKYIVKSPTLMEFFLPLINKEKISSLMATDKNVAAYVIKNCVNLPIFTEICKHILSADGNRKLQMQIRTFLTENPEIGRAFAAPPSMNGKVFRVIDNQELSTYEWTKKE